VELKNSKIVTFLMLFLYPILYKINLGPIGVDDIILFFTILFGVNLIKTKDFNFISLGIFLAIFIFHIFSQFNFNYIGNEGWNIDFNGEIIHNFFNFGESYQNIKSWIKFLISFFVIYNIGKNSDPRYLISFSKAFLIIQLLYMILIDEALGFNIGIERLSGTFFDEGGPQELACWALVFFILIRTKNNISRSVKLFYGLITLLILLYSLTITALTAFPLLIILSYLKSSYVFISGAIISALGLILPFVDYYYWQGLISDNVFLWHTLNIRIELWLQLFEVINGHFLIGLGTFPLVLENVFWYIFSFSGLFGLLLVTHRFYNILVNKMTNKNLYYQLIGVVLIIGLTSYSFFSKEGLALFMFILGIIQTKKFNEKTKSSIHITL
jgi:hypothetical protein